MAISQANQPKEFDINNPPPGLSREQVATLQAEQKRLAASTPIPVKRDQQIAALQATQAAATSKASGPASRGTRGASTMFSGKGTDTILAQDIYDVKESTTLNSVFESAKGSAKDAVKYISSNKSDARNLLNTALDLKSGRVDQLGALSRLGIGLNPATLLKVKSGAGGLLDKIATGLDISPDITNKIKVGMDAAVSYITTNDITRTQGSFELMQSLLGTPELLTFFDIEAETTLLTGMFDSAMEFGLGDVIDFTKSSGRYDMRSFEYAVLGASGTAVGGGDIDSIETILSHVGAEKLLGQNPNVIKDILRNYILRPEVTPDLYPAKLTQMKTLFGKIDAHWYEAKLGADWVVNYDTMSVISDDARKMFLTDPVLRDIVIVSPFYTERSPIMMGAAMYPGSSIGRVN